MSARGSAAVTARGPAPMLVLGLGNPLMGDDGVGWHVVERLGGDPRLPAGTEVRWIGSDLLAAAPSLAGRHRVVLVDAAADEPPGAVVELDPWAADLEARTAGAHALSLPAALRLLAATDPDLRALDLRLLVVGVAVARVGDRLSPIGEAALSRLVERVLAALATPTAAAATP